ncbi:terminus macrodomain insulation protein YfbV, partial [Motilimonas sp. 1_MG-2023]|uniref:terminus macrodomain insulation protein YfbV n=1 Tax=Motilimonas sp. 1_MG-2023 TaxID=3062672 RepID=UPI0026E1DF74
VFAEMFMPMLAVFTILLQYQVGHEMFWPNTVGMVLFMVSLPLQGIYWLGKRAHSPLPPSLVRWYHQIHQIVAQHSSEEN